MSRITAGAVSCSYGSLLLVMCCLHQHAACHPEVQQVITEMLDRQGRARQHIYVHCETWYLSERPSSSQLTAVQMLPNAMLQGARPHTW